LQLPDPKKSCFFDYLVSNVSELELNYQS
jgi:hypothetical protein